MRFSTALFGVVAFAAAALGIQFTSFPPSVVVGQTYTLTWSGEDPGQPVTLILRSGNPGDLTTVKTITTTASGGTYSWTPDSSIPDGSSYAIEIVQGTGTPNYSGQFSITGGSASAASSSAASVLSSQSSVASSMVSALSSIVSSQSVANSSKTATTTSGSNSTTTSSGSTSTKSSSSSSRGSTSGPSTPQATGNSAVSFGANQAVLALGAVAAILY